MLKLFPFRTCEGSNKWRRLINYSIDWFTETKARVMIAGCIMAASWFRPLKMSYSVVNVRILSCIAEISVVSLFVSTGARSPRAHAARIPATATIKDFAQTCRALLQQCLCDFSRRHIYLFQQIEVSQLVL